MDSKGSSDLKALVTQSAQRVALNIRAIRVRWTAVGAGFEWVVVDFFEFNKEHTKFLSADANSQILYFGSSLLRPNRVSACDTSAPHQVVSP